jgi:putative ABC transport system permease protein
MTRILRIISIYRIGASAYTDNSLTLSQPRTPRILGQTIEEASPEVKRSGYICRTIENHYKIGDEAFTNDAGFHCSDGFLQIFAIEIIQGKTWDLLTGPNRVIISESFARKYFGDENPVGEILRQYPAGRFEIEAVYRDFPENSHVRPDFLI